MIKIHAYRPKLHKAGILSILPKTRSPELCDVFAAKYAIDLVATVETHFGDTIVGRFAAAGYPRRFEGAVLYVDEEARRQGVGSALVAYAMRKLSRRRDYMAFNVYPRSDHALFLIRLGASPVRDAIAPPGTLRLVFRLHPDDWNRSAVFRRVLETAKLHEIKGCTLLTNLFQCQKR